MVKRTWWLISISARSTHPRVNNLTQSYVKPCAFQATPLNCDTDACISLWLGFDEHIVSLRFLTPTTISTIADDRFICTLGLNSEQICTYPFCVLIFCNYIRYTLLCLFLQDSNWTDIYFPGWKGLQQGGEGKLLTHCRNSGVKIDTMVLAHIDTKI